MGLSDFKVIKFLGKGSYGSVHKVIRKTDGKEYAIKEINIRNMNQREREEAANEIRILASVRHKFVVRYYEAFVEDHKLYIVTEYARGGDLYSAVKAQKAKNRYMDEDQIWSYFIQLCLGIRALHNMNILHRDLKSPNIFLLNEEEIKIGDLGVSKVIKNDRGVTKTQVGTPYYVAPEIWRKKPYDAKCDIWSLGCLLYEVAALRRPFEADNLNNLIQKVYQNRWQSLPSFYSRELHDLVKSLLVTDPTRRPTINDILEMKCIERRMHLVPGMEEASSSGVGSRQDVAGVDGVRLRSTIKVPRNLQNLGAHLPSPCYSGQKKAAGRSEHRRISGSRHPGVSSSSSSSSSSAPAGEAERAGGLPRPPGHPSNGNHHRGVGGRHQERDKENANVGYGGDQAPVDRKPSSSHADRVRPAGQQRPPLRPSVDYQNRPRGMPHANPYPKPPVGRPSTSSRRGQGLRPRGAGQPAGAAAAPMQPVRAAAAAAAAGYQPRYQPRPAAPALRYRW